MVTDKITREKWQYYPELFELKSILTGLEDEMAGLENVKEYRLDPRQEYRIIQTASKMSEIINRVEEDKGLVPDQLDLSFTHTEISEPTLPNQNDMQELS